MKQEYPKWLYSASGPRMVKDQAEHTALGPGWHNSPADVPAGSSPVAPAAPVAVVSEAVATPVAPVAAPADPVEAAKPEPDAAAAAAVKSEADSLYAAKVGVVVSMLAGSSVETLKHVQALEAQNPKGARSGVMKAIDAALAAAAK